MIDHPVRVGQKPHRTRHRLPARSDRAQVLYSIQSRGKTAGGRELRVFTLFVIPVIILIFRHDTEDGRQLGGESQTADVMRITQLVAQCSRWVADDALEFRFLRVMEIVAYLELITIGNGMVDVEAYKVAVVSFMPRTSLIVAHVIGVIEPNQGLVKGEIDGQRRTDFKTPTWLFVRLDRGGGVVIVKASHRGGDRPRLGLFLRRKARCISTVQTGGTDRGKTGGSDDFFHKLLSCLHRITPKNSLY